jgi:signal transduction histidine kinase
LSVVAREIDRLNRAVKTFLDFSKPIELQMEQCDLVALSREAVSLATPEAERRNIRITLETRVQRAVVLADRELVKQAMYNVLKNGLEAMREPGEVKLTISEAFHLYVVSVEDRGAGIAPELHDKIFNLYFTTKPNSSGIGLALTFLVLQLHNGAIDFDSEPGKGTSFRMRFPATRGAAGASANTEKEAPVQ